MSVSLIDHFSTLEDPRRDHNKRHAPVGYMVGSKLSLPKKQNKAAWDDDYRAKILFS